MYLRPFCWQGLKDWRIFQHNRQNTKIRGWSWWEHLRVLISFSFLFLFLNCSYFILFFFRERERDGERGGRKHVVKERDQWVALAHAQNLGLNLQPLHLLWLGNKPVAFGFEGQCLTNWALLVRAQGTNVHEADHSYPFLSKRIVYEFMLLA